MKMMLSRSAFTVAIALVLTLAMPAVMITQAFAGLETLKGFPIPLPPNLGDFVVDQAAAIQLGKALFWDMQTGGDGVQACATCHFQAGEDVRRIRSINPGPNGIFDEVGPNGKLYSPMFPFDSDDIKGAQGITKRLFLGLSGGRVDNCQEVPDELFTNNGKNLRQVTGRKAPTVINSIFNLRSFWDGRANNIFNGVTPVGADPQVFVYRVVGGTPTPVNVRITNASLASQAVGPPNNSVEMSCAGRTFPQLGRKLLGLTPLGRQIVDPTDSVLGSLSRYPDKGLNTTYADLIQAAFSPNWWDSATTVNGFAVMEQNFSLFWGLSIMLYESTLVSDDSRFDRFMAGDQSALTELEQRGMTLFGGKAGCTQCHDRAELTVATVSRDKSLEGFRNIGVRPLAEDGGDVLQAGQAKFKIPGLRNVELRGPYFHTGKTLSLRQVVEFYNRGGDFPDAFTDGQIKPLGLSSGEVRAITAFLLSLTDDRVRFERAPFDRPAISIPALGTLRAVGAEGRTSPLRPFLNANPFKH